MQETEETRVKSLGPEDPLEEMATYSIFSPGESHGWRSLAGYSPWSRKESDMTEVTEHACTHSTLSETFGFQHRIYSCHQEIFTCD